MKSFAADALRVNIYRDRAAMGRAAAADIAAAIREVLARREECSMIFAAAPSQNEVLAALAADETIDFSRIRAFHMDEYCGLDPAAPQGFGNFLRAALFDRVPFRAVYYLNGAAPDWEAECARYGRLLQEHPADIVCLGIGENGHVAFNDPPVADFHDPVPVKRVALDPVCRQQQVNDGCFAALEQVPTHALTLTVPALFRGGRLFCVVPGPTKAGAVRDTVLGPVDEACPASILRRHIGAALYLDEDSASYLPPAGPEDWVSGLDAAKRTGQLLIVEAAGSRARVSFHRKGEDGRWTEAFSTDGYVGANGLGKCGEGDGRSPMGAFRFTMAFGARPDPGCAIPYTRLDGSHRWVDDPVSAYYNRFVSVDDVRPDWSSAEELLDVGAAYNYALALDYNSAAVPGLGSAIFLHCATGGPTAGCVSIPEGDMLTLLRAVEPECVTIIDTPEGVRGY